LEGWVSPSAPSHLVCRARDRAFGGVCLFQFVTITCFASSGHAARASKGTAGHGFGYRPRWAGTARASRRGQFIGDLEGGEQEIIFCPTRRATTLARMAQALWRTPMEGEVGGDPARPLCVNGVGQRKELGRPVRASRVRTATPMAAQFLGGGRKDGARGRARSVLVSAIVVFDGERSFRPNRCFAKATASPVLIFECGKLSSGPSSSSSGRSRAGGITTSNFIRRAP